MIQLPSILPPLPRLLSFNILLFFTLHHSLTDFSLPSTCYPSYTLDHALHYSTNYTYTCQPRSFTMNQTLSTCHVESILPVQRQSTRSNRNTNPRYTKFLQPVWKQRKLPVPEPQSQPPAPSRPAQAERVNKRVRRYSFSASSVSPAPSEPVPKTANPPAPRHSLPKVKPAPKIARPGPSRSQPNRGDTQPSTARATPINTPDDRPTKPPRDDTTAKPSRATRLLDQSSPLGSEIRNEASLILASAAKHREDNPLLSSPDDELTPASSTRLVRPMSPNTGGLEPRIRNTSADEDEASEHGEDFDTALEKVKQAYRNGIRPCNNPYAPQERSVPVHGLEDANPPEWLDDQPPMIVPAPRRDRALPTDPAGRAHREGFEGLSEELAIDADGFLENVKVGLRGFCKQGTGANDAKGQFIQHPHILPSPARSAP